MCYFTIAWKNKQDVLCIFVQKSTKKELPAIADSSNILFPASDNGFGYIAEYKKVVLVVGVDGYLHQAVPAAAPFQAGDLRITLEDILGIDRLVPLNPGGFPRQQLPAEEILLQVFRPHGQEGHNAGGNQSAEGRRWR